MEDCHKTISNCKPNALLNLHSRVSISRAQIFNHEIQDGLAKNFIKKSIHHPEITSKKVSITKSIQSQFFAAVLTEARPFRPVLKVFAHAQYAKLLEEISISFDFTIKKLEIANYAALLNKQTTPMLQALEIYLYCLKSPSEFTFRTLGNSISRLRELKKFKLGLCSVLKVSEADYTQLAIALRKLKKLEDLSLTIEPPNHDYTLSVPLFEAISSLDNLKSLYLDITLFEIDPFEELNPICSNIKELKRLEILKLKIRYYEEQEERIGVIGTHLAEINNLKSLTIHLDYWSSGNKKSLKQLGIAIKNLTKLENLSLRFESPEYSGYDFITVPKEFSEALVNFSNLYKFSLSIIGVSQFFHEQDIIYNSIIYFKKLKSLKLSLRYDTKRENQLADVLQKIGELKNLESFKLNSLILERNHFIILSNSLKNLTKLKLLKLDFRLLYLSNVITSEDENTFFESISCLKELQSLRLNYFPKRNMSIPLKYLSQITGMTSIDFDFEIVTLIDGDLDEIGNGLSEIQNLQIVKLNFGDKKSITVKKFVQMIGHVYFQLKNLNFMKVKVANLSDLDENISELETFLDKSPIPNLSLVFDAKVSRKESKEILKKISLRNSKMKAKRFEKNIQDDY